MMGDKPSPKRTRPVEATEGVGAEKRKTKGKPVPIQFRAASAWTNLRGKRLKRTTEINPLAAKRRGGAGVDDAMCLVVEEIDAVEYMSSSSSRFLAKPVAPSLLWGDTEASDKAKKKTKLKNGKEQLKSSVTTIDSRNTGQRESPPSNILDSKSSHENNCGDFEQQRVLALADMAALKAKHKSGELSMVDFTTQKTDVLRRMESIRKASARAEKKQKAKGGAIAEDNGAGQYRNLRADIENDCEANKGKMGVLVSRSKVKDKKQKKEKRCKTAKNHVMDRAIEIATENPKADIVRGRKKEKDDENYYDLLDDDDKSLEGSAAAWRGTGIHRWLLQAIVRKGFAVGPTPVQAAVLPRALGVVGEGGPRDVVGAAPTGSGKTLAYGLPVLDWLLRRTTLHNALSSSPPGERIGTILARVRRHLRDGIPLPVVHQTPPRRQLEALILTPTRELAMQVSDHLNSLLKLSKCAVTALALDQYLDDLRRQRRRERRKTRRNEMVVSAVITSGGGDSVARLDTYVTDAKKPPREPKLDNFVLVACLVGGMSAQKQIRVLDRRPPIVVSTAGRLWELMADRGHRHLRLQPPPYRRMSFEVPGGFPTTSSCFGSFGIRFLVIDEADRMAQRGAFPELDEIFDQITKPPPTQHQRITARLARKCRASQRLARWKRMASMGPSTSAANCDETEPILDSAEQEEQARRARFAAAAAEGFGDKPGQWNEESSSSDEIEENTDVLYSGTENTEDEEEEDEEDYEDDEDEDEMAIFNNDSDENEDESDESDEDEDEGEEDNRYPRKAKKKSFSTSSFRYAQPGDFIDDDEDLILKNSLNETVEYKQKEKNKEVGQGMNSKLTKSTISFKSLMNMASSNEALPLDAGEVQLINLKDIQSDQQSINEQQIVTASMNKEKESSEGGHGKGNEISKSKKQQRVEAYHARRDRWQKEDDTFNTMLLEANGEDTGEEEGETDSDDSSENSDEDSISGLNENNFLSHLEPRQTLIFSATLTLPDEDRKVVVLSRKEKKQQSHAKGKIAAVGADAVNAKKEKQRGGKIERFSAKYTADNDKSTCFERSVLGRLMRRIGVNGDPFIADVSSGNVASSMENASRGKASSNDSTQNDMNVQKGITSKDRTSTSKISLPAGLTIRHIHLLQAEKDAYTYHFLLSRPRGRTLIFVNAIATAKRVAATLTLLGVKAKAIHAEMQQRQRLKALDRFREDGSDNDEDPIASKNEEDLLSVDNGIIKQEKKQSLGAASERTVLVATDVAARGLDISRVAHVVHYDLPRTADTFVHRSGRTARADATGMALVLVSESDALAYEAILKSIFGAIKAETAISSKSSVILRPNFEERATLDGQDSNIDKLQTSIVPRPFEIDLGLLRVAVDRTIVASKLVKFEEAQNRAASESNWFKKQAAAMDVMIDDFDDFDDLNTPAGRQGKRVSSKDGVRRSAENLQAARLRKQLSELLARPIRGRGSAGEKPQRKKLNGTTKQNPQNMLKRKRGGSLRKKKR